jgi:integrase
MTKEVNLKMSIKQRKRKDGKSVFDVRVQSGNVRISRTISTTRTQAERVEHEIRKKLIEGQFDIKKPKDNPKFSVYAREYEKSVVWQKSYRRTRQLIRHLVDYFGERVLSEITGQDFINYRTMRLASVKPATVNRERACLLRMLNLAIKNEKLLINKNPLDGIKPLKEAPAENRTLTLEEYVKLIEAAPEYFRRILLFACNTGMRLMEILNLTFGQLRLYFDKVEVVLYDTKSGLKEYIPLNEEVKNQIFGIAAEKSINLHELSEKDKKENVFTGNNGQRIQSVRKPMLRTFKEAGIEKRPFHTFRHFWTKMMFESGVDPYTIKKVGRWKDFDTMLKYCYTTRPEEYEAVNKLSVALNRQPHMHNFAQAGRSVGGNMVAMDRKWEISH